MALAAQLFLPLLFVAQQRDPRLLRMSEEAELFAQSAAELISEETLKQKAMRPEKRSFFRVGQSALEAPKVSLQERELKSEFGYVQVTEDGQPLFHEARQILSVDGKPKQSSDKARRRLIAGMKSGDDEVKKNLLEDLQKQGLEGSATDFTLMLLIFRARNLPMLEMTLGRKARLGAESVQIYSFEQRTGEGKFTIFNGKEVVHQKLQGEIWLRESDGLPLRITFVSVIPFPDGHTLVDQGEVDYVRSESGVLAPVSAKHKRTEASKLLAENLFTYSNFRKFSAASEVKFGETAPKR